MQLPGRYGVNAAWYDLVALERPVYRSARLAGVAGLHLRPGDRVLDLGCGTGYNLPLLLAAVGLTGSVVGVDASATMLARASRRADHRVQLVHGDAGEVGALLHDELFDALLCTYALSVMAPWQTAWQQAFSLLRPGGRAAVVDLALPQSRWLRPLAQLACLAGGADPRRAPWRLLERDAIDITQQRRVAGHVRIVSGTKTPT